MPLPPIQDEDLVLIFAESRALSLKFKHGFIHHTHLYVAMLTTKCKANRLCAHDKPLEWTDRLQKLYPPTGTDAADASLPLTLTAERSVRHAGIISQKTGDTRVNSAHLLMAILSFFSGVSESFDKAGVTFDDVVAAYGQQTFEKFPPPISPVGPASAWSRLFTPAKARKKTLEAAIKNATLDLSYALYDQCIADCRVGLSIDPDHAELRHCILVAHFRKRDFREALPLLLPFLEQSPEDKDFRISLAYIYNGTGEYEKAEEVLTQLLVEFPKDEIVLNNLGMSLTHQQRYAEAIVPLEKATALNPAFAYPWDNLGFARCKLGEVSAGLELIDKSLEMDKGNSYAYRNKGIVFFEQNRHGEALKQFQLALKFGYTEKYGSEVSEYLEKLKGVAGGMGVAGGAGMPG
jgi:tetratricopeptide (TPR) repeat protein